MSKKNLNLIVFSFSLLVMMWLKDNVCWLLLNISYNATHLQTLFTLMVTLQYKL